MFTSYLENFLKKYSLTPKSIKDRYITLDGKNCKIIIWYDARVYVYKNGKLTKFKFSEKKIKKYLTF